MILRKVQESECVALSLAPTKYLSAWNIQKKFHAKVVSGELPSVLLMLEHPHVYTLGRQSDDSDILATPELLEQKNIELHQVDRGGKVTYHGPGQLVGYPIINLSKWRGGALEYVRAIENTLMATLSEFDIPAQSPKTATGVWVNNSKIAAIGVKISRGVTTHGFALNVNTDLSYFNHIVPCGMPDIRMTSMNSEIPKPVNIPTVIKKFTHHFEKVFQLTVKWSSPELLLE